MSRRRVGRVRVARPSRPRRGCAGLTIVDVTLMICIAGILLAVGVPTFVRALRTSKLSEPPEELQRIYLAVASYYAGSSDPATNGPHHCLPQSAGPTPAKASKEPVVVQFAGSGTEGADTWAALHYEPSRPIRYRYQLLVKRAGCGVLRDTQGPFTLSVRAEGDLDGDGAHSLFERNARVEAGQLTADPLLLVRDAVE